MMILLSTWSAVAFVWWGIALALLASARRWKTSPARVARPTLTVFKPLPPVRSERERAALRDAIESFACQLGVGDELIVGINACDEAAWQPAVLLWRAAAAKARVEIMAREMPVQCANPKIAWLQMLSPAAHAELWLWSDADVTAPAGFLDAACVQLLRDGSNAITAAYRIQHVSQPCEVLDALFVNVEFLPGALLLGQLKRNDFAYGAATLFRAETFRQRVNWEQLGAALADDHKLGELLQPVTLARVMTCTFTQPSGWLAAWQHYYRWQKTVRWCRPGGFAALLVMMPAIGWSGAGLFGVDASVQCLGLACVIGGEIVVALVACWLVGCRLPVTTLPGVLLWPFTRVVTWLLVWFPLPVLWSGRQREWFSPVQK